MQAAQNCLPTISQRLIFIMSFSCFVKAACKACDEISSLLAMSAVASNMSSKTLDSSLILLHGMNDPGCQAEWWRERSKVREGQCKWRQNWGYWIQIKLPIKLVNKRDDRIIDSPGKKSEENQDESFSFLVLSSKHNKVDKQTYIPREK